MLQRISFLCLLLGFCASVSEPQQQPPAQISIIRAGRLLDVDSGRVLTNQMILIRGGKIEAVGEHPAIPPARR